LQNLYQFNGEAVLDNFVNHFKMKLKTLTALFASVSAVSFKSIPLNSEPNFDEMTLDA